MNKQTLTELNIRVFRIKINLAESQNSVRGRSRGGFSRRENLLVKLKKKKKWIKRCEIKLESKKMSKFHEKYEFIHVQFNKLEIIYVRSQKKKIVFVNNRNRKKFDSQIIIIIIRGEKSSGIKIKEISDDAFRKWDPHNWRIMNSGNGWIVFDNRLTAGNGTISQ